MKFGPYEIGGDPIFFLGPCVIENEEDCLENAQEIKELVEKTGAKVIFKSSFYKANRTDPEAYRGPGLEEGLRILGKVKEVTELPVITDIHYFEHVWELEDHSIDSIQTPQMRMNDNTLLEEALYSNLPVLVKKSVSAASNLAMQKVAAHKVRPKKDNVLICERGEVSRYGIEINWIEFLKLQNNFRNVCLDVTHPVGENCGGGAPEHSVQLAKSAVALGCPAIFAECRYEPEDASCDRHKMLDIEQAKELIETCLQQARSNSKQRGT